MANIGKLTQHFAWILGKIIEYPQGYPLHIITSGILRSDSPSLPWNGGLRNPSMRKSEVQTKQEKLHRIAVECILRRYSCACVIFRRHRVFAENPPGTGCIANSTISPVPYFLEPSRRPDRSVPLMEGVFADVTWIIRFLPEFFESTKIYVILKFNSNFA